MNKYIKVGVFIFVMVLFISFSYFVFASSVNIISNPSLDTVDPNNNSLPQDWLEGQWGMNVAKFSYLATGHTGDRSGQVQVFHYLSGDAKWYFAPVAVQPDTQYIFSDYYEATVPTYVVAQFDDGNGNLSYQDLVDVVPASSTWAQTNISFTTPANTKIVTIFHLINSVGVLTTDDFALSEAPLPVDPINPPPTITPVTTNTPNVSVEHSHGGGQLLARVVPGCDNRTTGFSTTTSQSCVGNIVSTSTSTTPQVLGAQVFHFSRTQKRGSKGNEVVELEKFLSNAGYYNGKVDGIFGSQVKAALVKFQMANKLKVDGIVGSQVRETLNNFSL